MEQRQAAPAPEGWTFNGGEVVMSKAENRVQIIFSANPEQEKLLEQIMEQIEEVVPEVIDLANELTQHSKQHELGGMEQI